jgi:hypothetical protein
MSAPTAHGALRRCGRTPSGVRGYSIGRFIVRSALVADRTRSLAFPDTALPSVCRIDAQHAGVDHYIKVSGRAILLVVTKGLPPGHVPPVILQAGLRREGNTGTRTPRMISASALQQIRVRNRRAPWCERHGAGGTRDVRRMGCANCFKWPVGCRGSGKRAAESNVVDGLPLALGSHGVRVTRRVAPASCAHPSNARRRSRS